LTGTGADPGDASLEGIFSAGLSPDDLFFFGGEPESLPNVRALARAIGDIHRYDGIRATFRKRGRRARLLFDFFGIASPGRGHAVFRHDELRIAGKAKVDFRVLPGRG
jgi:hypothetical protein